jgi:hypothetical protein
MMVASVLKRFVYASMSRVTAGNNKASNSKSETRLGAWQRDF